MVIGLPATLSEHPPAPQSGARVAPDQPGVGGRTILVVEDDEAVRDVLTMFLEDDGYPVMHAPDGATALRLLEENRQTGQLGLVLLDLMIPGVDGLAVLRHLATSGPLVPVIAMSASSLHLRQAALGGARETVQKPFDVDQILAVVARCSPRGRSRLH
jgi:CheY-like chemotaxis protein